MSTYLLIQTRAGTGSVADTLRAIPGITSVDDVTGAFDAVAVAGDSSWDVAEAIVPAIRRVPGILRVLTAPHMDGTSPLMLRDNPAAA